jgi:two-component system, NarL family, invasion response regulator UvrY
MKKDSPITIAVVDDHKLFRSGIINLIHSLGKEFKVVMDANNGKEFIDQINKDDLPDIALIDVGMPVMDGFQTATMLQKNYPQVHVLVITMVQDEKTLIRMLRLGIKGYLSKDVEPSELKQALYAISQKGFYYTDYITGKLIETIQDPQKQDNIISQLSERELQFLELTCSEHTYKEIAEIMCLSVKTIDGYRNMLFEKLHLKSRVGLVMFAIKNGLVSL